MKRTISILMLILILSDALPSEVNADTSGTQVITVSIPCTVTLLIGEHGAVQVNGKNYTGNASIQAPVGSSLTYIIIPDSGYEISKLTYDGADVTSAVKNGRYRAAALEYNVTVKVSFVEQTSPGNPRTGDNSRIRLWITLMCGSGISLILLWRRERRRT